MNNEFVSRVKVNLSKNGVFVSNLVTNLLLIKNLGKHYKLVKSSLKENLVDSPYLRLKKVVADHPEILNKTAISQDKDVDYRTLINEIENMSSYLQRELNISKGEVVSICAESSIEGIISFFALNSLGAVEARIFNGSKNEKFKSNLFDFNSTTVLVDEKNIQVLTEIAKDTKLKNVILISKCDQELIDTFKEKNPNINLIDWETIQLNGGKMPLHENVEVREHDLAAVLYTSGSSGEPKPISIANKSFTRMVDTVRITTGEHVANDEKVLGVVSHEYPYAANNSTIMILLLGKTLVMPTHENTINMNKIFAKGLNKVQAIPSFYKILEDQLASNDMSIESREELIKNLACLDYIVSGGEPYTKSEKHNILELMADMGYAPLLIDGFGFGEMGSAAALKFGLSDYFLLMNGIEACAIDEKTGKVLPKGESGILCLAGPTIAKGYYNNEEATKKSFITDKDGKQWFISDTYGSVHGLGSRLVELRGRIRECFITGDGNGNFVKVYSGNIEDLILSTGLVEDCIVVPSDKGSTPTPVAYISLKRDCKLSKEEITELLMSKCTALENFAQPTEYNFEEVIRRTKADKKDYNYYKEKREDFSL